MSNREGRLNRRAAELRTAEHVAQIRVANASRGLTGNHMTSDVLDAYRAELSAARAALRAIHVEQQNLIDQLDRHTVNFPEMAMIMVETPDGYRVFEHRDGSDDEGGWNALNDPHGAAHMTFDEITGETTDDGDGYERYSQRNFYRIYTQDEVDDILDQAGI